jgi:hypothetical protein
MILRNLLNLRFFICGPLTVFVASNNLWNVKDRLLITNSRGALVKPLLLGGLTDRLGK